MKKVYLILAIVSIGFTGCSTGYRVYVNGFSEIEQPVKENAAFTVAADVNSRNPIMDSRIKNRIEELLKYNGYSIADANGRFDYKLTFRTGRQDYQTVEYEPFYHSYVGFYGGHHSGYGFGYTSYYPSYQLYEAQWLEMKLLAPAAPGDSKAEKVIWVGEAITETNGQDQRIVIDYLLVGCLEYLGQETGKQKSLFIKEDDPRITMLETYN
jgi:hypothetical protein